MSYAPLDVRVPALLLLALSIGGCGSVVTVGQMYPDLEPEALPLEIGCDAEPSDAITLVGAELSGTILRLDLRHGGGCAEHAYRVCGAREVLRTDPGQWALTVLHDANGDECRAERFVALEVDIAGRGPVGLGEIHQRSVTVMVE